MATYVLGDIQGCYDELQAMLDQLKFNPASDQLWFVGDLVNRGPKSLEVLRFIKSLGHSAISVLGNHDLHLLALTCGNEKKKDNHSLDDVLSAPDRDELVYWLRHRPLMHSDETLGFSMIHAGLPPKWNLATAARCAREVEHVLQDDDAHHEYFEYMYGNKPDKWDPDLEGMDRLRFITNCFTRLRYCTLKGKLGLKQKGPPGSQEAGYIPWYAHPKRKTREDRIVFGHWSMLGYQTIANTWAIDSGCLWGGTLTALRIDSDQPQDFHLPCAKQQNPKDFLLEETEEAVTSIL